MCVCDVPELASVREDQSRGGARAADLALSGTAARGQLDPSLRLEQRFKLSTSNTDLPTFLQSHLSSSVPLYPGDHYPQVAMPASGMVSPTPLTSSYCQEPILNLHGSSHSSFLRIPPLRLPLASKVISPKLGSDGGTPCQPLSKVQWDSPVPATRSNSMLPCYEDTAVPGECSPSLGTLSRLQSALGICTWPGCLCLLHPHALFSKPTHSTKQFHCHFLSFSSPLC